MVQMQKTTLKSTSLGKTAAEQRANMRARVRKHQESAPKVRPPEKATVVNAKTATVLAGPTQAQFDALHAKFDALLKLVESVVDNLDPVLEVARGYKAQVDAAKAAAVPTETPPAGGL